MEDLGSETARLLTAARTRGRQEMGSILIPAGLDHFTAYVGLIGSALELGKLIQTEERDLTVIGRHYELEMARISTAFAEVESAMISDFRKDESLKATTFEMIEALIAAGQHEIALEFYKLMLAGFKRPALETLLEHRNTIAKSSGSTLKLK